MNRHYAAALRYQAAWLDAEPERLQGEGFVNPTPERDRKIPGYPNPLRVHALRMEGSEEIYAACAPGLEKKLRLKKPTSRFFWFDRPNPAIDISRAQALAGEDLPAFLRFFQEAYPDARAYDWIPAYFHEMAALRRCFGVFENGRLACVADAPTIPYLPELVVEPGIMTLPEFRRKGYAAAACAAFIEEQLRRGLSPIWTCAMDNEASAGLAQHLGYKPFGALWRM
ncbi:MAG: GNAT family N-acetyltransferase [Oscillospiraceae bacterium]|jgi:RimJ/RimL family protein N-acetyltransferase|nr:GNAT family N-acetyltransferase [Oscillospiraceae bacterium]